MRTARRELKILAVAFTLVVLLIIGLRASVSAVPPLEGVPAFGHVFLIVGENMEPSQVNVSASPFLAGTVKHESAWLTNYYAITHYSLANYIAMTSGQFTTCEQGDGSPAACHQDVNNLFHQMDDGGISWTSWMESMPSACYLSDSGADYTFNSYATKHNPALYYDSVEGQDGVWSATNTSPGCQANDIPAGTVGPDNMSYFNADLAAGRVPQFNYIIPNECENAHDLCGSAGSPVAQFDSFLAREVPLIMKSPAYQRDGVIIITSDEGPVNGSGPVGGGGNVVFAVISPLARPGVYNGSYDHYSLLRTLEDGFEIPSYLGNATSASPISSIWT